MAWLINLNAHSLGAVCYREAGPHPSNAVPANMEKCNDRAGGSRVEEKTQESLVRAYNSNRDKIDRAANKKPRRSGVLTNADSYLSSFASAQANSHQAQSEQGKGGRLRNAGDGFKLR